MHRRTAKRISLGILGAGLIAAAILFVLAEPPEGDPLGYDRLMNKRYVHELQRLGGKTNVLVAELMADFRGLFEGTNLAYTVAVLSALAAWLFWYVATFPPDRADALPATTPPREK